MIRQAVAIDTEVYKEDFRGIYETCVGWWKRNPDIYIMMTEEETGEVIGYINMMPVSSECYDRLRSGKSLDTEIPVSEIEIYDAPGTFSMYLSSIAIRSDRQGTQAFHILMDGFASHIKELASRWIIFSRIVGDAVSSKGCKVCEYIGLTYIKDSEHDSRIYEGIMIPFEMRKDSFLYKFADIYLNKV
jgi:hypothetical protein